MVFAKCKPQFSPSVFLIGALHFKIGKIAHVVEKANLFRITDPSSLESSSTYPVLINLLI